MKRQLIDAQAKILDRLPQALKISANLIRVLPEYLSYKQNPKGLLRTSHILEDCCNQYQGHRCVLIGNGPSINHIDLSLLNNEYTFGLNRIYLLFQKSGFETDFLVSINRLVIEQFFDEIEQTSCKKFLNWKYVKNREVGESTSLICAAPVMEPHGNIIRGYYHYSGSVANVALEIAYFLGFSEVILIGFDHSFADKGIPGKVIVSQEADKNHFNANYFGKGVAWQLPSNEITEYAFAKAKVLFERDQRTIVDATPGGKLEIFRKVDFHDYLLKSKYLNKKTREDHSLKACP